MIHEWEYAHEISRTHGDSFFVFDEQRFRANFTRLQRAFLDVYPRTAIAYSYKTNYTPYICKIVDELGGFAEVVSEMELALTRRLGIAPERCIYNGPNKSTDSIAEALLAGATVNLDSTRDVENVLRVTQTCTTRNFDVAIRCNFPLNSEDRSRFGFDVDGAEFDSAVMAIRRSSNVRLAGLHCHFPDRDLSGYQVRATRMVQLAKKLFEGEPSFLNLGGGFFGDMPSSLRKTLTSEPVRFEDYGRLIGGIFKEAFAASSTPPTLFIEPGTALVANTFRFYAKVIGTKTIQRKHIAIAAASIFDISPAARSLSLPVRLLSSRGVDCNGTKKKRWDVSGYTCIESDYLSKNLEAEIAVGDYLVYENVGSYSIVMKPPFILPGAAILADRGDNQPLRVIKNRETADYIFNNFVF